MKKALLNEKVLSNAISIPRQLTCMIKQDKYVIPSYIFLSMNVNRYKIVKFKMSDYYSFMGEKGYATTSKRRVFYNNALKKVIDLLKSNESHIPFAIENIDLFTKKSANTIIFKSNDEFLTLKNNKCGYTPIDIDLIEKIYNYYKDRRINLFCKTTSVYCYLMMNMTYPKNKNIDGSYKYSNNPIYYTAFKYKITENINMSIAEFETCIKALVDIGLIRTYFPGYYNGKMMVQNEQQLNITVAKMPTVFLPAVCPQVIEFDNDTNFNEALRKICKENGYNFKKYTKKIFNS